MHKFWVLVFLFAALACAAGKLPARRLIELAQSNSPQLRESLIESLGEPNIRKGTAALGEGEDFIWAVESVTRPELLLDGAPGPPMSQIDGTHIWWAAGRLAAGTAHEFSYSVDGKAFGGRTDVPAFGPDSYLKPGVPTGRLTEKQVHTSRIYDGMRSDYWIYTPAQYDPRIPAALMVWQDGHFYNRRDSDAFRVLDAIDNLTHERKIPVMIQVFISPGDITPSPDSETYKTALAFSRTSKQALRVAMRSVEYDTVTDRYARMLRDELLPEIAARYNIRKDAYSRAIGGLSSGGICSFNVAWQQPDQFSRVHSWIGTFLALQPEPEWGGQVFPAKVQKEPKRNIRVWLQDGAEDGKGPQYLGLQNVALANALKGRDYDFHLSYGGGSHSSAQGSAEFPRSFAWLWRDYNPARTEQEFVIEPAEKAKPFFRVRIYNRDHSAQ